MAEVDFTGRVDFENNTAVYRGGQVKLLACYTSPHRQEVVSANESGRVYFHMSCPRWNYASILARKRVMIWLCTCRYLHLLASFSIYNSCIPSHHARLWRHESLGQPGDTVYF